MNYRRVVILQVLALLLSASCTGRDDQTVNGFVNLDGPLIGASIRVEDGDGSLLAEQQDATSLTGAFSLTAEAYPQDFRIVATGGSVNGQAFAGTVVAEVRGYQHRENVYYNLNPVSTLNARYQQAHPELSMNEVEDRVKEYLDVPDFIDLVDLLNWSPGLFFSETFMQRAAAGGGYDAFIEQLATEVGTGRVQTFVDSEQLVRGAGGAGGGY